MSWVLPAVLAALALAGLAYIAGDWLKRRRQDDPLRSFPSDDDTPDDDPEPWRQGR